MLRTSSGLWGETATSTSAAVGFSTVKVAVLLPPGGRCPPNHPVIGWALPDSPILSRFSMVEFTSAMGPLSTPLMLRYEASLCTAKTPPSPCTKSTALLASTSPDPWVRASFCRSDAVDIRMFLTTNGSYSTMFSRMLCIRTAALPATRGVAMLVPPNSEKDSASESFSSLSTLEGTKLCAPLLIRSGLGSPIIPGPLLEKSTTWPWCSVLFPNLGWSLNGPYPTKTLLVVAPTEIPNGAELGIPIVPYPGPELPALVTIVTPGKSSSRECGTARAPSTSERMSIPGAAPRVGKLDTPQLLDTMSALGLPVNSHRVSSLSKPAVHSHAYTVSPNHSDFTGRMLAPGAAPTMEYFPVSLYMSYSWTPLEATDAALEVPCP